MIRHQHAFLAVFFCCLFIWCVSRIASDFSSRPVSFAVWYNMANSAIEPGMTVVRNILSNYFTGTIKGK